MPLADTARLIASLELQDKFTGPARNAEAALGRLEGRTGTLGRIGNEAGRGLGNLATNVARIGVFAGGAAATGLVAAVNAASDLNEEIDKSSVVFGRAATRVQEFSESAAAIGLAQAEALGAAGAFGNMFNTIGLAADESADMSIAMVQLAADMASFNNEDPSEMLDKLRSGLSGEAEPLRRFGVLLSEVTVREFAFRTGIARTGTALTEAQKVQARYGLILEQTAIQQGNFADTSSSMANQQRILRANITNTGAVIGTALLPKISEMITKLNDLVLANRPFIQDFADKLPAVFDRAAALITNLPWGAIGSSFELMGHGANALLTAFTSLPPWVQTAVITGWGLNKLTGGALGNIVGTLASGLIRGILNMNAGVVNINAGVVNGGPGTPGRGGGKFPFLPVGFGLGAAAAVAAPLVLSGSDNLEAQLAQNTAQLERGEITQAEFNAMWGDYLRRESVALPKKFGTGTSDWAQGLNDVLKQTGTSDWAQGLNKVNTTMQPLTTALGELTNVIRTTDQFGSKKTGTSEWAEAQVSISGIFKAGVTLNPSQVTDLREPTRIAAEKLRAIDAWNRLLGSRHLDELRITRQVTSERLSSLNTKADAQTGVLRSISGYTAGSSAKQDAIVSAVRNQSGLLGQIRDKSLSVKVNVQNNVQVGVSEIQYRIQSVTQTISGTTTPTSPVAI